MDRAFYYIPMSEKNFTPTKYIARLEETLPPIQCLTEAQTNEVDALFYAAKLEYDVDPFQMGKHIPLPRVYKFFHTLMYHGQRQASVESGLTPSVIRVYRKVEGFEQVLRIAVELYKDYKQNRLEKIMIDRLDNPTETTGGDRLLEFAIKHEADKDKEVNNVNAQVNNIENQVIYNIQVPQLLVDNKSIDV